MTVMASGARRAFYPPEACAGRRCQQRLSRQRYAGHRAQPSNTFISFAGWSAYCGGGRSDVALTRAGIPLDVMYDVVTHAAGNSDVRKPYAACR